MKTFYLDNAATTACFDEELALFNEASRAYFYNPSASYLPARRVREKFEHSREEITQCLHGAGGHLYFLSSATEANNLVFKGINLRPGDAIMISKGEHPSVFEPAHALEKLGVRVIELPIDKTGTVNEAEFSRLLSEEKNIKLISIIHCSNETGAVNDISNLVKLAKTKCPDAKFHSDGVQAFGKIGVNLNNLGVDFYTISAHKVYSPRGIAGLWVKAGAKVSPMLLGGGQESGVRSSTENVIGAMMFALGAKKACQERDYNYKKITELRRLFLEKLGQSRVGELMILNSGEGASPYIISLGFKGVKGEVLVNALEADGIYISKGSACSTKKAGNRVLEAMGVSKENIVSSVRFSFSPYEEYDVEFIVAAIEKNVLRFSAQAK